MTSAASLLRRAAPALVAFVAVRALGLIVLAALALASDHHAYRRLVSWDSQWYQGIADNGYGFVRIHEDGRHLADYAFFPLYPLLERLVAFVMGLSYVDAGLVISWVASIVAAWGIFAVADHLYGRQVGLIAVVLWAALPVSIVLSMAYSEALFTALAAWSLYATVTRRWVLAGVLASLAGLTRPVGVAVVAAVVLTAVVTLVRAPRSTPDRATVLAGAAIAPLGWLAYLGWVGYETDSVAGYFDVTEGWGNTFDGGRSFVAWVWSYLASDKFLLGLLICVGVALLLFLLARCLRERQPLPLLVYAVMLVAVGLSTSGYFGSKPRYLLPAFSLLFPVARWLARQRRATRVALLVLAVVSSVVYGGTWLLGSGPP